MQLVISMLEIQAAFAILTLVNIVVLNFRSHCTVYSFMKIFFYFQYHSSSFLVEENMVL